MQPVCELTTARAELHQLRHLQGTLSSELARHASQLKSIGALPPDELVDELISFRTRLVKLTEAIPACPGAATARPDAAPEISLDRVQAAIQESESTEQIVATLTRVLLLTPADGAEVEGLARCHESAARLKSRFETLSNQLGSVSSGELNSDCQTFQALLKLVDSAAGLGDEEWTAAQELVQATWGRRLAIAVARGKIRSAVPPVVKLPAVAMISETSELTQIAAVKSTIEKAVSPSTAERRIVQAPRPDSPPTMRFIGSSLPGVGPLQATSTALPKNPPVAVSMARVTSPTIQGDTVEDDLVQDDSAQGDSIGKLAEQAFKAEGESRRSLLSEVALQLIREDRTALAFQLIRASEDRLHRDDASAPAWMLHALTLGRHLCYSQGEIARLLEEDLSHFQPEFLSQNSPERNAETGFLLRAAALIPALLASSPAAAVILRSFRITPGLTHLYNYCSRVLTYGQQLNGQAADLFTPNCDRSRWDGEVTRLRQAVDVWLTESIERYSASTRTSPMFLDVHWTLLASPTVRHPAAARLWSKWQEVYRLVARLLKPISTGEETERNWVKAEIDRLTQCVRLESATHESTASVAVGAISFPLEDMLNMIHEAIDYASRWLRLCASKPAQGRTLASRDAEMLRDEILARTDGVITELQAYSTNHDALRSRVAIASLCRTIEHLSSIFSPDSTLALREKDPREIVSGELRNIPGLQLDEHGIPVANSVTLENEILAYLSRPS